MLKKFLGAFVTFEEPTASSGLSIEDILKEDISTNDTTFVPEPPPVIVTEPDKPFEQIYSEAGLVQVSYTVEKLLRVADGLKAMGPTMAAQALAAMDEADDSWSIPEVLADRDAKVNVLNQVLNGLQIRSTEAKTSRDEKASKADAILEEAKTTIAAQIAELQTTLVDITTQVATEKDSIEQEYLATLAKNEKETGRVRDEISRLLTVDRFVQQKG